MNTSAQQARKSRQVQDAWDRYNSDTKHLKTNDPDYRAKERKAWATLQASLRAIR